MNIKNFKFRQILFFFVILGVFFAFSCDDKTDLNNIASEIEIGGSASLPLIKESEFSMYDLLKSYGDVSVVPGMSLDTLDGDILLIYSDTFQYAMPSINKLFGTFNADMEGIGIAHLLDENQTLLELLKIQPQTLPYAQKLYDDDWEDEYDLNEEDNIEDEIRDRQLLTKILFENTTINVTVDPNFEIRNEGVLVMEVELPGIDGDSIHLKNINVTSKKTFSFPQNKFYFNASGKIKTHVVLTGDGETRIDENSRIDISVSFVPTNENYRYACYGLFNYILDDVANFNIEDYKADLHDYIPKGSALHFEDPKFEFAAISNLGLDLEFHMDTVQSFIDEKGIKSINPTQTRQATVKRAGKLDEKTTTSDLFKMDKDYFNRNGAEISDFFTTDLDSMNFVYHLSTASEKKVPKEELIIGDKFKEEFIPSDGQLTVYGKMTIPMSFDTGSVLCYSDTIEFDFSDPTLDDVSKLKLFFNYTNNFPLGMFVDVFLLDENKQSLSTKPYQEIYMDRPETYPDGENKGRVKTPKTGEFSIAFENGKANSIDKLKEAHYICVSYRSEKENLDQAPPMRLSTSDKMTVRITCEIDGKIILENK